MNVVNVVMALNVVNAVQDEQRALCSNRLIINNGVEDWFEVVYDNKPAG